MSNKAQAMEVIRQLRRNGFEALLAGGCVRDMLLGQRANDYDVATSAAPQQVVRLFKKTLTAGARFGVVMVIMDAKEVEVATFRTETGYADGRHPENVRFSSAEQDAKRRDFTINAMFYDVGNPRQRFAEDYLRMLRAVRFSTKLNFKIEPDTYRAICKFAPMIKKISGERIRTELEAILAEPTRKKAAVLLTETGIAEAIFEGFSGKKARLAVETLGHLPGRASFALALSGCFVGFETHLAMQRLKVLKLSRKTTRHTKFLLENRNILTKPNLSTAQLRLLASEPYFHDLFHLQEAIQKSTAQSTEPLKDVKKRLKQFKTIPLKPKPLLNGHQLIKIGAIPGPTLGQLAEEMYIAQLEGQLKTKKQARNWARKWLQARKGIET